MSDTLNSDGAGAALTHVDNCVQAADALKTSLLSERAALTGNDAEQLENAVADKERRLRELAELLRGRSRGNAAAPSAAPSRWQAFLSLAAECEGLNSANGAAIRLRQQHVEQGIALLRGGEKPTKVYGPRGVADASLNGRSLTEA